MIAEGEHQEQGRGYERCKDVKRIENTLMTLAER